MACSSAVQLTVTETGTEISQPKNGGKRLLGIHSVHGSSTAACRGYCMTIEHSSPTGSTSQTRVRFKLAVLMYRSLHGTAPLYLMNSCILHYRHWRPVALRWGSHEQLYRPLTLPLPADVAGGQRLRSASQRKLIVPRYRLNNFWKHTFLRNIDEITPHIRWRHSVVVSALVSINVVNRHWARLSGYLPRRDGRLSWPIKLTIKRNTTKTRPSIMVNSCGQTADWSRTFSAVFWNVFVSVS